MAEKPHLQIKDFADQQVLFCYLDEAGDFDFSPKGSAYYLYTALVTDSPLALNNDMMHAKYRLILENLPLSKSHQGNDYFHASEDAPLTRELAFEAIEKHLDEFRIYSIIIQKNKANPSIRDPKPFFSMIMENLLKDVILYERVVDNYDHICIMTDRVPVQKKRAAIIGAMKRNLKTLLQGKTKYSLTSMDSKSDFGLQAADYCSWALYRSWTNGDEQYRDKIASSVKHEEDFFHNGKRVYY